MNFDIESIKKDFDFAHIKYGRGATILAIPKSNEELHTVAYSFHHNESKNPILGYGVTLQKVEQIEEIDDFVIVCIEDGFESRSYPKTEIRGLIKRILPKNQVTLEILSENTQSSES